MNKTLKKTLSLVLAISMLLSLAVTAYAVDPTVSVTGPSEVTVGESVTFVASIENNPGVAGIGFVYQIKDKNGNDANSYFESAPNEDGDWCVLSKPGALRKSSGDPVGTLTVGTSISWLNTANVTKNGSLFDFYLRAKNNVIDGEYTISMQLDGGEEKNFCNAEQQAVPVTFAEYKFTVKGGISPDDVKINITKQPEGATYIYPASTNTHTLTVEASVKAGYLSYQWYSKASGDKDFSAIAEGTNNSITVNLPAVGTSTEYYCVVTNTLNNQVVATTQSETVSVTYNKGTLTDKTLTLDENSFVYDGSSQAPTASIVGLTSDDYTLSGTQSATNVGDYTITATGKGNYEGSTNATWKITPAEISVNENPSMTIYTNNKDYVIEPKVLNVVTKGNQKATVTYALAEGSDQYVTLNGSTLKAVKATPDEVTATVIATITAPNHEQKTVNIAVTVQDKATVNDKVSFSAKEGPFVYSPGIHYLSEFVSEATFTGTSSGTPSIRYTVNGVEATLGDTTLTDAGTYTVTAIYEDDTQYGEKPVTITINKATIDVPTKIDELVYEANDVKTGVADPAPDAVYTVTGNKETNAGNYEAKAVIKQEYKNNYEWNIVDGPNTSEDQTIPWSIARKPIDVPKAVTNLVYVDANTELTGVNPSSDGSYTITDNTGTDAGNYVAKVTPTANYQWGNDDYGTKDVEWKIAPKPIDVSTVSFSAPNYTYNKTAQSVALSDVPENVTVSVKEGTAAATQTDADTYNTTFVLAPASTNYTLTGRDSNEIEATWTIKKATVEVPTAISNLVYDGTLQTGVADPADDAVYTVTGNKGTDAGDEYNATASLKVQKNYEWIVGNGNTSADQTIPWSIAKAAAKTDLPFPAQTIRYDDTTGLLIDGDQFITGGNVTLGTITVDGNAASVLTVIAENNDVKVTLNNSDMANAGKTATITVNFTTPNYDGINTTTIPLTINSKIIVKDKITFSGGEVTYNGQAQRPADATITGIVPAGDSTWTYEFKDKDGNVVDEMINAGEYKVTATYEDADHYGQTDPVTFTINPAEVTITGGTATKTYDGNTTATVTEPTVTGVVDGKTLAYTISDAVYASENAGEHRVTYTVALVENDVTENYVLTSNDGETSGTIKPKEITVTIKELDGGYYTGSPKTFDELLGDVTGVINGYTLVAGTDYTVSYTNNKNAGPATVTVSAVDGKNYTFDDVERGFTIAKKSISVETVTVEDKDYDGTTTATVKAVTFSDLAPNETLELGMDKDFTATGTFADAKVNPEGTIVTCVVTLNESSSVAKNYILSNPNGDTTAYITKATPTVTPSYTAINTSGKTLADAMLVVGQSSTPGTIKWVDSADESVTLPDDTEVKANTAYKWLFTPEDGENYENETGTITLYSYIPYIPPVQKEEPVVVDKTETENGTVEVETGKVTVGDPVTIVPTPEEGYRPGKVVVKDENGNVIPAKYLGNGKYSFVKPEGKVTITAEFKEGEWENRFEDVKEDDWFYDSIQYVDDMGLMNGVSTEGFAPVERLTRGMLMTMLARLEGLDTNAGDVWYETGLTWAKEAGISDGTMPMAEITREQAIAMLYRYAGSPEVSDDHLAKFGDQSNISDWAAAAMNWAVSIGLMEGDGVNLYPDSTATRAEIAALIMRFAENPNR